MLYKELKDISKMKRVDIVPYYVSLLQDRAAPDIETQKLNKLILTKFTPNGLLWIKGKAWKEIEKGKQN